MAPSFLVCNFIPSQTPKISVTAIINGIQTDNFLLLFSIYLVVYALLLNSINFNHFNPGSFQQLNAIVHVIWLREYDPSDSGLNDQLGTFNAR
jgi:hypothetical protein